MKKKILYLLCGVPGSGKSHWANGVKDAVVVSRDTIRFSILKDDEDYFSHENEVFETFVYQINEALKSNDLVIADATHISEKSRNKTLDRLILHNVSVIPVSFENPIGLALERNSQRSGRSLVPKSVIRRMYAQYQPPTKNEKYEYEYIITIKENDAE